VFATNGPRGLPGFPNNLTIVLGNGGAQTTLTIFEYHAGNFTSAPDIQALVMPQCTALFPAGTPYIAGQPRFGDSLWTISPSESYTVTCATRGLQYQNSTTFPCNYEAFEYNNIVDDPDGGYCQFPCPRRWFYNNAQLHLASQILGWPTMLVLAVTIVLRCSVAQFSRYPANLLQLMLLGGFVFNFVQGLGLTVGGMKYVTCARTTSTNGWGHAGVAGDTAAPVTGMCGLSALAYVWGWLVYTIAWAAISLHSAIIVFLKRNPFNRVTMYSTYAVVIGFPSIACAALFSAGFESGYTEPYCNPATALPAPIRYVFFFVPILLAAFVATVSIIYVVVAMALVTDRLSSWHISRNLRLVAFLTISLFLILCLITYKLYYGSTTGSVNAQNVDANRKMWLCEVVFDSSVCHRANFDIMHNTSFVAVYIVMLAVGPLSVALVLLTQAELWKQWDDRLTPLAWAKACCWDDPMQHGGSTTTTAGSTSGGSSGESTILSDLQ